MLALQVLHVKPVLHFAESELIAKSLAADNLFGNPYKVPTGPTAHHAPVYPFLLSLIFRAFGYDAAASLAMVAMNISFASLQYALLPLLGIMTGTWRASVVAGFVGALVPWRILRDIRWETSLSGLALLLAVLFTLKAWKECAEASTGLGLDKSEDDKRASLGKAPASPTRWIALCGFFWGILFLTCPSALPVFLLFLLFFTLKQGWKPAFWVTVICGLTVLPWCLRNYFQLGGFVFIRDNLPIELHVSNNDFASPLLEDNIQDVPGNFFHKMHPYSSEPEARAVAKEGELAYNREKLHETLDWIRTHPRKFVLLTAERIVFFWVLASRGMVQIKSFVFVPVEALAIWGLALVLKQDVPLGWIMLAIWAGFPLVYYVVQNDSRYHYPLDWSTFFLATLAVGRWLETRLRIRGSNSRSEQELGPHAGAPALS